MISKPLLLLFYLLTPIVLIIVINQFFEEGQKQVGIPIIVIDEDHTELSETIVHRLKNMEGNVRFVERNFEQAQKLLLQNEVDSVFVIKEGFHDSLITEQKKEMIEIWLSPYSLAYGIVREVIASEVMRYSSDVKAANDVIKYYDKHRVPYESDEQLWKDAYEYTEQQWIPKPLMTINYEQDEGLIQPDGTLLEKDQVDFNLKIWVFFTLFIIFLSCDWLVRERHLFSRIKVSYHGLSRYVIQKSTVLFIVHSSQATLSFLLFYKSRSLNEFLAMILFIILSLSIGVVIATFFGRKESYYIASLFIAILLLSSGSGNLPLSLEMNWMTDVLSWSPINVFIESFYSLSWLYHVWLLFLSVFFLGIGLWKLRVTYD
ncbi:ABC transporter permease [Bacillus solimangrovi]|nr:ABC transporter permease [Bacillus solimangrovi]